MCGVRVRFGDVDDGVDAAKFFETKSPASFEMSLRTPWVAISDTRECSNVTTSGRLGLDLVGQLRVIVGGSGNFLEYDANFALGRVVGVDNVLGALES